MVCSRRDRQLGVREFEWFQYQSGILDEATWQSYMAPMSTIFAPARARNVLQSYTGDPEFTAHVIDWLADASAEAH